MDTHRHVVVLEDVVVDVENLGGLKGWLAYVSDARAWSERLREVHTPPPRGWTK